MKKRKLIKWTSVILFAPYLFACSPSTQEQMQVGDASRAGIGVLALKKQAFTDSMPLVLFKDRALQDTLLVCSLDSIAQSYPFLLYPQDSIAYWKCLGWNRHHYVVSLNHDEWNQKAYIALDTARFRFIPWKDLLSNAGEVERLSFEKNPVRVSPKDAAMTAVWDSPQYRRFRVKEVYKQWLRVGDEQKDGWIRWVYHDTLYIKVADTLWHTLKGMVLPPDPTTDPLIHRLNAAEKKN
jgi:hypothetical protein